MILWLSIALAEPTTVLLGNSLAQQNDLPSQLLDDLQTVPAWPEAEIETLLISSSSFVQHLASLQSGGLWADTLVDRVPPASHLVLNDRPNTPAFPIGSDEFEDSYAALEIIVASVDPSVDPVLYMTWGRREDSFTPWTSVQEDLSDGYVEYATRLRAAGHPVAIAPVGRAWRQVYDDLLAAGDDPLLPDSLFSRLFAADDSHPSELGSYIARAVLFTALTGRDPASPALPPPPAIDAATAATLQDAARAVTSDPFDPELGFHWAHTWSTWGGATGPVVQIGQAKERTVVRLDTLASADDVRVGGTVDGLPAAGELRVEPSGTLAVGALLVGPEGELNLAGRLDWSPAAPPMDLQGTVLGAGTLGVDACPPGRTSLATLGADSDVSGWTLDAPCDATLEVDAGELVLVVAEVVDTDPPTDGPTTDTGTADTDTDADTGPGADPTDADQATGCGCTSGSGAIGWWLVAPGLLGLLGRR